MTRLLRSLIITAAAPPSCGERSVSRGTSLCSPAGWEGLDQERAGEAGEADRDQVEVGVDADRLQHEEHDGSEDQDPRGGEREATSHDLLLSLATPEQTAEEAADPATGPPAYGRGFLVFGKTLDLHLRERNVDTARPDAANPLGRYEARRAQDVDRHGESGEDVGVGIADHALDLSDRLAL